jgi:hypothetical protein
VDRPKRTNKKQGFNSMSPERRRIVASMGGKAATNRHKWTREECAENGRIGGRISKRRKREMTNGEPTT